MNSVWLTSPFVKFNSENLTYNETLCSEARFLQKFSRTDGHEGNSSTNNERRKNSTRTSGYSSNSNLPPEEELEDEEHEIRFAMSSSSITRQHGKEISVSSTVIKVYSKRTLKKREASGESSDTNSRNDTTRTSTECCQNGANEASDEIRETDVKSELCGTSKGRQYADCSVKTTKTQSPRKRTGKTENRTIGDALFSCPFELVEIYPANKENIVALHRGPSDMSREGSSMRSFPKEDNESSKSIVLEDHVIPLSKARSKEYEADAGAVSGNTKCGYGDENDVENVDESSPSNLQSQSPLIQSISSTQNTHGSRIQMNLKGDGNGKQSSERLNLIMTSEVSQKSCLKEKNETDVQKERSAKVIEKFERSEDLLKYDTKEVDCSRIVNNSETLTSREKCIKNDGTKSTRCNKFEKTMKKDGSVRIKEKDQKVKGISSVGVLNVSESDLHDGDSVNFSETKTSNSICDSSNSSDSSDTSVSTVNDTVIDVRETKLYSANDSVHLEKVARTVAERQENERKNANQIGLRDEKKRIIRIYDRQNDQNRNTWKTMEEFVADYLSGVTTKKETKLSHNHENVRLCQVLSKIHEQLLISSQKVESILMNLQGSDSIGPHYLTTRFRRLTEIIARCKGYIHASNDIYKAESEITKSMSKFIIQLAKSLDLNKLILKQQEQQFYSLKLECYQTQKSHRKTKMMQEVTTFWDHWRYQIYDILENMSDAVEMIMVDNEEKENVKDLTNRKYKRAGRCSLKKSPKILLTKKESNIETQMSIALNANNPTKQSKSKTALSTPRYHEKDRVVEITQSKIVERRTNDSVRFPEKGKHRKQLVPRQKQPVWRPGGVVKPPSSISATMLAQRLRAPGTHATDRVSQPLENTKEAKQRRTDESKKKIPTETCVMKDMVPTLETNWLKTSGKRSSTSLKTSPRPKLRPGVLRVIPKLHNPAFCRSESPCSKNGEKTPSWEKIGRQRTSKVSRVLQVLEKIIKPNPTDRKCSKSINRLGDCYEHHADTNPPSSGQGARSTSIDEEIKIMQEEPTKDVGTSQTIKDRPKFPEMLHENPPLTEKITQYTLTPTILSTDFPSSSVTDADDVIVNSRLVSNFENDRPKDDSNLISVTNVMADVDSSSVCVTKIESSKCCQTSMSSVLSLSTPNQEPINHEFRKSNNSEECSADFVEKKSQDSAISRKGRRKSSSSVKEERSTVSSHTTLLTMLKEFLYDQGVDAHLVNMAEQSIKNRRKFRSTLKKKSVSLADVVMSSAHNRKHSEILLQNFSSPGNTLNNVIERREEVSVDLTDTLRKSSETCKMGLKSPLSEVKNIGTCTEKNSNDASMQTDFQRKQNKGLQSIFEDDTSSAVQQQATKTQTDMVSVEHAASQYCEQIMKEIRKLTCNSASLMTDSLLMRDNGTETAQASYVSKSVATDLLNLNIQLTNFPDLSINSVETRNGTCPQKILHQYEENSAQNKHHTFGQLLKQMQESSDEISGNGEQNGGEYELNFAESDASMSSSSLKPSKLNKSSDSNETVDAGGTKFPTKVISSETMAALQIAAIRARNVYKAIDIYKRHLKSKLKRQESRRKLQKAKNKKPGVCKELLESLLKSVDVSITDSDLSCEGNIVEILPRPELASSSEDSEYEVSKSDTTPVASIRQEGGHTFKKIDLEIRKKSSNSVVLKDVKSLMECLVQKMEDGKVERNGYRFNTGSARNNLCADWRHILQHSLGYKLTYVELPSLGCVAGSAANLHVNGYVGK
ncbi:hypothetical protein WN55_05437 [Dufourea novaeangliae]|uniref:Uncharacterized protein n=1 Tax=Dufourea novaeangliae TaxID=178035 RepID=A0A154P0M8_DUFNO|nr:hypothetical protein WN55_05437 [Dufourea novaeangliae]